jgi:hypothetical protein
MTFQMRRLVPLSVLVVALAACGSGTEGLAIVANTQQTLTPGPNRILLAIASEEDGSLISHPDVATLARFFHDGEEVAAVDTEWIWAIPNVRGFLVAHVEFTAPGRWEVVLEPEGGPPTPPTPFGVQSSSLVPDIGDRAIPVETRTYPEFELSDISSAPDPDPSLHELSLATALASGRPTVIAFATPAFCQTAACGPTLEVVTDVKDEYPDVNFLHVEIYSDLDAAAQGSLDPVPAVVEWGLPSEPWVFVVDADGIITARFEGATGAEELRRALDGLG